MNSTGCDADGMMHGNMVATGMKSIKLFRVLFGFVWCSVLPFSHRIALDARVQTEASYHLSKTVS